MTGDSSGFNWRAEAVPEVDLTTPETTPPAPVSRTSGLRMPPGAASTPSVAPVEHPSPAPAEAPIEAAVPDVVPAATDVADVGDRPAAGDSVTTVAEHARPAGSPRTGGPRFGGARFTSAPAAVAPAGVPSVVGSSAPAAVAPTTAVSRVTRADALPSVFVAPPQPATVIDLPSDFRRGARAPFAVAAVAVAATVAAVVMVRKLTEAPQRFGSHAFGWTVSLVTPTDFNAALHERFDGSTRLTIGIVVVAALATVAWAVAVVRLPRGRRMSGENVVVALVGLPWWYAVAMMSDKPARMDLDEIRTRMLAATVLLIVSGAARVLVTARVWSAGRLPAPIASLVISVSGIVGVALLVLPVLVTSFAVDKDGGGHSPWWPTQRQLDWSGHLTTFSMVATFVLLVVVTANQARLIHLHHKAELAAEREAAAAEAAAA
jgi:hypothetical protein